MKLVVSGDWLLKASLVRAKEKQKALQKRLQEETECRRRIMLYLAYHSRCDREALFQDLLTLEGMHRRDRRLPRCALVNPQSSPWMKLFSSGNDQALITISGFDHRSFNFLLQKFRPYFNAYTPWTGANEGSSFKRKTSKPNARSGRPRLVDARTALGLALAWYRF